MKCFEVVFSPTGGTKKAADIICANLCEKTEDVVDLTDRNKDFNEVAFSEDDVVIAALPVYGGRLPEVASSRLSHIKGNGAKAVAIAVYGNRDYEDALIELNDILTEKGFNVVAGVAALAEHSIMRNFAAGRPDEEDIKALSDFGRKIAEKIQSGDEKTPEIPGNRPYKDLKAASLIPETDSEKCISCGLCMRICPVAAIDENDFTKTNGEKCIGCTRCIYYCPKKARALNQEKLAGLIGKIGSLLEGRKENELFI